MGKMIQEGSADIGARLKLAEGTLIGAGWEYIPNAMFGPIWKPPVNVAMAVMRRERDEARGERDELAARLTTLSEMSEDRRSEMAAVISLHEHMVERLKGERDDARQRAENVRATLSAELEYEIRRTRSLEAAVSDLTARVNELERENAHAVAENQRLAGQLRKLRPLVSYGGTY